KKIDGSEKELEVEALAMLVCSLVVVTLGETRLDYLLTEAQELSLLKQLKKAKKLGFSDAMLG
ncbi:9427_t:CDS:1, partial [Gigaspora rosea]